MVQARTRKMADETIANVTDSPSAPGAKIERAVEDRIARSLNTGRTDQARHQQAVEERGRTVRGRPATGCGKGEATPTPEHGAASARHPFFVDNSVAQPLGPCANGAWGGRSQAVE